MTELIEKVPAETRWKIATEGLTGALTAYGKALKEAAGDEKYNEFIKALWYEAGKRAKGFADNLRLDCESPRELEEVTELLAITSMGPEFDFKFIESTEDKCVGKALVCPWHERWKELGLDFDFCGSGHQGWGDGCIGSLNPNFTFSLTKSMVRGDQFCEWIIERKK